MRRLAIPLVLLAACTGKDDSSAPDSTPEDACPVVAWAPAELAWADLTLGEAATQAVTVTNNCAGEATLHVSAGVDVATFTLDPSTLDLAPGASAEVSVTVTVPDHTPLTGTLTLSTDDPAAPTADIPLTATARDDQDGDGAGWEADCDDANAAVYPGAPETWYDGVDTDCSGGSDYDQDGDGADAAEHGGEDCDDLDPTFGPGAEEVWYDGLDQDCGGDDDWDQDGDGAQVWPTGADCADTDPTTTVGTAEVRNGLDDDCNGEIDEGLVEVGDVLITEVMANPSAADDTSGEWVELRNPREEAIDLAGWTLSGTDGDLVTIAGSLVLEPGAAVVLGPDADTAANGGVSLAYAYDGAALSFGDTVDDLTLTSADGLAVASLAWDRSWGVRAGASVSLDPLYEAAVADPASWCASTSTFGAGDRGTPGLVNDPCSSLDHDGDAESPDDGDCDDADPSVSSGAAELENGLDENCNDYVDELPFDGSGLPYLTGAARPNYLSPIDFADGDGDGVEELYVNIYDGYLQVWAIPAAGWESWAGTNRDYGTQVLQDAPSDFGSICCDHYSEWTDLDGDGAADIPEFGGTRSSPELHVFLTAAMTRTAEQAADIVVVESGSGSVLPMGQTDGDFDGDGVPEVVFQSRYHSESSLSYEGKAALYSLAGLPSGSSLTTADATVTLLGGSRDDNLGVDADLADWTGDGYPDLAVAGAETVWLVPGDGLATTGEVSVSDVATATIDTRACAREPSVRTFDDDGDGVPALVVFCDRFARWGDASSVTGSLALDDAPSLLTGTDIAVGTDLARAPADVDGDGLADLRVSTYASSGRGGTMLYALGVDDWPAGSAALGAGLDMIDYPALYSRWGPATDLDGDGAPEHTLGNAEENSNRGMLYVWGP